MKYFMLLLSFSFSALAAPQSIQELLKDHTCTVTVHQDFVVKKYESSVRIETGSGLFKKQVKLFLKEVDHFSNRRIKAGRKLKVDYVTNGGRVHFVDESIHGLMITPLVGDYSTSTLDDFQRFTNGKLTMKCSGVSYLEKEI